MNNLKNNVSWCKTRTGLKITNKTVKVHGLLKNFELFYNVKNSIVYLFKKIKKKIRVIDIELAKLRYNQEYKKRSIFTLLVFLF